MLAMLGVCGLGLTPALLHARVANNAAGQRARQILPAPMPPGYAAMARRFGVPPMVLYGIALQESAMLFGTWSLPWPWTLNVQGSPKRYATYPESVAAMRGYIAAGIRNLDAGLMQVNWRFHRDKLIDPARALDPYPNIAVGAHILRGHFNATGDWPRAVGRYHSPGDSVRADAYAAAVYRLIARLAPHKEAASG
ncbi:MAG TPA: transglycosylase SLT domain-containing protein [Aquabacterium sp.]|nr:transglycosylase SLT domain-containing protein [Aquabacterium sp.]